MNSNAIKQISQAIAAMNSIREVNKEHEGADDDQSDTSSCSSSPEELATNPISAGSFADSVSPIDFIDEDGNLPMTNMPGLLPAVQEEEEEEDEDYLLPFTLPISPMKGGVGAGGLAVGEEDTLSTIGSESARPLEIVDSQSFETTLSHSHSSTSNSTRTSTKKEKDNEEERTKAVLIMRGVIFKQRSFIKHAARDKERSTKKYVKCKSENKKLSKENKNLQKELKKLSKHPPRESLEQEIELLREELELAKLELGRRRPGARKVPFVEMLHKMNDARKGGGDCKKGSC
jgi:hypothetical protein